MKKIISTLWLTLVLLFIYLPIFVLCIYSFLDTPTIGASGNFTWANYIRLFTTAELREMLLGTFSLALRASCIATILGTVGAVGSYYTRKKAKSFLTTANQIPIVNADVVTGFSLCILLIVVFKMDKNTFLPLIIGHVVLSTPFVYLSVLPKLKQMDHSLYEAALDLGATSTKALLKVVLPQIYPGIISGFFLAITLSLDDYFITTYTKPATFNTISTYVVNATKGSNTEIKTALWSLSTLLFVAIVFIVLISNVITGRKLPQTKKESKLTTGRKWNKQMGKIGMFFFVIFAGIGIITPVQASDTVVLKVGNWEEYMDEGDWDLDEAIDLEKETIYSKNGLVSDFEDWYFQTYGTKVKVEYSTFGTNEDLYSKIILGETYDVVCPSEYMIMKLLKEERLLPLSTSFFDTTIEENYYARGISPYIQSIFETNRIDEKSWSEYMAGYMWGTIGMVYNPQKVKEQDVSTWNVLTNPKYNKQVTIKDSARESYFPALAILNQNLLVSDQFKSKIDYQENLASVMNDTSDQTIQGAEEILQKIRQNVYAFETDSGKSDMITGKIVANLQWSGDAVYAMDQAEEEGLSLNYAVPKECTNMWLDGWVMLKAGINQDPKKQQVAEAFINFISRPDNVVRNMYYIGYTSVISGGEDSLVYDYLKWNFQADDGDSNTIAYPLGYFFSGDNEDLNYILRANEEQKNRQLFAQYPPVEVIERSAIMGYFSDETNQKLNQMWINVRCFNFDQLQIRKLIPVFVFLIFFGAGALCLVIIRNKVRKR